MSYGKEELLNIDLWIEVLYSLYDKHTIQDLAPLSLPEVRETVVDSLLAGDYEFGAPRLVYIPKDDGGKRGIYVLDAVDRAVMKVIYELTYASNKNKIHSTCLSYQKKVAISAITKKVQHAYKTNAVGYKVDLHKYFDSLSMDLISKHIDALDCPEGIKTCLKHFYALNKVKIKDEIIDKETGLCQGVAMSVLLANTILYDLDSLLSEKADFYCRYSDDIVFFGDNPNSLLETLKAKLSEYGVEINQRKLEFLTGEFTFLGAKISKDYIHVSTHKRANIRELIHTTVHKLKTNCTPEKYVTKAIRSVYRKLSSRGGQYSVLTQWFSLITDDYDLLWLESFVKDTIRAHYTKSNNITHNLHKLPNSMFVKCGWNRLTYLRNLYNSSKVAYYCFMKNLINPLKPATERVPISIEQLTALITQIVPCAKYSRNYRFYCDYLDPAVPITPEESNDANRELKHLLESVTIDFPEDLHYITIYEGVVLFRDWFGGLL